jgi:hypothetical protein
VPARVGQFALLVHSAAEMLQVPVLVHCAFVVQAVAVLMLQ